MRILVSLLLINLASVAIADVEQEFFCEVSDAYHYYGNDTYDDRPRTEKFYLTVNNTKPSLSSSYSGYLLSCDGEIVNEINKDLSDQKGGAYIGPIFHYGHNARTGRAEKNIIVASCIVNAGTELEIDRLTFDLSNNTYTSTVFDQRDVNHKFNGSYTELGRSHIYWVERGNCRRIFPHERLLTLASYLGTAEFCHAYGIDYRDLANKIINGTLKSTNFNAVFTEADLLQAVERGNFGEIYSVERGDFVSIPAESDNPFEGCKRAHLEVLKISKLK